MVYNILCECKISWKQESRDYCFNKFPQYGKCCLLISHDGLTFKNLSS